MANSQPVTYQFKEFELTLSIVVALPAASFEAEDGKSYSGYAVISGTGAYTNGQPFTFQIAPQSVSSLNVLWANSTCGTGGKSSYGIDQWGLTIMGDDGQLYWDGLRRRDFGIQEGAIPAGASLTLVKSNWPPKA